MLLSWKYNFIFIHVMKAAGSSMHTTLLKYTRKPYESLSTRVLRKLNLRLSSYDFSYHCSAKKIKDNLGAETYDRFFSFAFVRNPWDWQVSLYEYILQEENHHQHKDIKLMHSFEEYLEWRVTKDLILQKEFVTDGTGEIIVDFVGRFENLKADFQHICNAIGVKEDLPHINKTKNRRIYTDYYNKRSKNIVAEYYQEDIELFGYSFDNETNKIN